MDKAKLRIFWKVLRGRLIFSFILIAGLFIFTRWVLPVVHQPPAAMTIQEAGEHQLIRLRKNIDSGPVQGLRIKLSGHLNGTAMVRIFEGENPDKIYREKMIGSGKIDGIFLDGDWYTDDCRMEYEPLSTTNGQLKIEYLFKTSKPRAI